MGSEVAMKFISPRFQIISAVLLFLIAVVLGTQQTTRAGLADGAGAYNRGDYATALKEFRPLAERGNTLSQYLLGVMYYEGRGVPQDYKEAVKWFRKAAEQGDPGAQFSLGLMYADGNGVPKNYVSAHMWLNLAAAKGHKEAVKMRDNLEKRMTRSQIAEAQRMAKQWKPKKSQ